MPKASAPQSLAGFTEGFGYRPKATSGLTFAYAGGVLVDSATGLPVLIADGVLSMSDDTTNYIERTTAGAVSTNTTGFTDNRVPLWVVTTANGQITQVRDLRGAWDELTTETTGGGATPTLGDVLAEGNDAGAVAIANLADPGDDQDAATKAYVDAAETAAEDYADTAAAAAVVSAQASVRAINTQTGDYILALTDAGKVVEANKATAISLTIPPNADVAFPVGSIVYLTQYGAGATTIVAGAGVTLRTAPGATLVLAGQYGMAMAVQRAADEWYVTGDLTNA